MVFQFSKRAHNELFGIVPGTGRSHNGSCVAILLGGREGTHKQKHQKIPGKCLDSPRPGIISRQAHEEVVHAFSCFYWLFLEPPVWGRQKGSPRFVSISPFSSDLFRFALLVFRTTRFVSICSDFFRFVPICYVFCYLDFVKEFPLFLTQVSAKTANLG